MKIKSEKIPFKHLHKHETKQYILIKFLAVLAILFAYFLFISHRYGVKDGFFVTFLTWSLFVLGTPVADAGFLIDFPVRMLFHIKMFYSEVIVWLIALSLNFYAIIFRPEIYETTHILYFFKKILVNPFPYWGIIILSALGTFVSVRFGDELMETISHHERSFYHKHKYNYHFLILIFIFAISFALYGFLLKKLGLESLF
jgi:hypothetical protein